MCVCLYKEGLISKDKNSRFYQLGLQIPIQKGVELVEVTWGGLLLNQGRFFFGDKVMVYWKNFFKKRVIYVGWSFKSFQLIRFLIRGNTNLSLYPIPINYSLFEFLWNFSSHDDSRAYLLMWTLLGFVYNYKSTICSDLSII